MQVVFVGGASSVGASCLAIHLANQWIVVDAGVRVDRKADPLPDLALLEGKDIRAIFVTHAHADHIGALPLLHQAFPSAPIFASRGTALLMEVMLADALKVMTRRAVEEMELPLYPEALVSSMLNRIRPLPVGEPVTLSELPGITISASRAGHIAAAVSLGFVAADGSLVVSGDISITPQRTVLGAVPPPIAHPDLLILESTYGSRLHPNRQSEEQRLGQAVADSLARGGHTLIPCFGLGRGQELLLLLQAAQEKGQIPDFPIYVDGLVRRVCLTYLLLPEALSPRLQRQIRKGYQPFTGPNVTFVRDQRDRERILAGPPACIISSSGMLTGGPSAWYAAQLLSHPDASILITGYQDEESPGKRLLDVAEHKNSTLDIGGQSLQVLCHVAKYSLSAHADGSELAAYAATLHPRRVALVHGDSDARTALRTLLTGTDVILPSEGMTLTRDGGDDNVVGRGVIHHARSSAATLLPALPIGIGQGIPFDYSHIEQLWQTVTHIPTLRIVTARELALVWYGQVTEGSTQDILDTFAQDYEQRYFIRQHSLEEAYRVRGVAEETPSDFLSDLVDSVLLLLLNLESAKPVICRAIEPGAAVRVQLPRGISQERVRFPFSSILEILGPVPQDIQHIPQKAPTYLNELIKAARRIRRTLSVHTLATLCHEEAMYTLSELCMMAGISSQSLEERLALAKLLHQHPLLFTQSRSVFDGEGLTLYSLAPEWREALVQPEDYERPDQNWILSVIEHYLGTPPDLYRRSIDPDTGAVVLAFHFPATAATRHAQAIAVAAEETGISITIAPKAHQGELVKAALRCLPANLSTQSTPSLYHDRSVISLNCLGQASTEEITTAQSDFYAETGWYLELTGESASASFSPPQELPELVSTVVRGSVIPPALGDSIDHASGEADSAQFADNILTSQPTRRLPMNQHDVLQFAQRMLSTLPGFSKVGADIATFTLLLRFHFPAVAQMRYATVFEQLEAHSGWHVRLQPTAHQGALVEMAHRLLPQGLSSLGSPSLYLDQHSLGLNCQGEATSQAIQDAQQRFIEETGWHLQLLLPGQKPNTPPRMPQKQATALISASFSTLPGFYRVGADATKGILWVHFHFPDIVKQLYTEQLATLATQTGWRVYLYPYADQKALIDFATQLLPPGISPSGKPTFYENRRTLSLTCPEPRSPEVQQTIQHTFTQQTGWHLELLLATTDL